MDKNAIKKYAIWARRELIERVTQKALKYGISPQNIGDPDAKSVGDTVLTSTEFKQRAALILAIRDKGFEQVMEEVAYTWFNRFVALRFMEVNGYIPSHVRVFTDDNNDFKPQILSEAIHLELDGLDMEKVYELKDSNQTEDLFRYLLIVQCNDLNSILPGMFQKIEDFTELLLPDYLLREGSVIEQLIALIPEEDWKDQVQIIGWLYQYYNSEKKDDVFAALKKNVKITKENIPAATQLFTPDWIVRYMVENSLGRLWLEGHPDEALQASWKYYLEEAKQEPDVEEQLKEIRKEYANMIPEQIKCIDPCCGSGHILAYLFDVLVQIYENYGYTAREAAASIVEHNLYGLDIDDRAAQLAYFSVMMKARQYDRRFFSRGVQPHVYAIRESNHIPEYIVEYFCNGDESLSTDIKILMKEMWDAKEYGSILNVSQVDFDRIYKRFDEAKEDISYIYRTDTIDELLPLVQCAEALAQKYDVVVTNPPYMGNRGMGVALSDYITENYTETKSDLFSVFIERGVSFLKAKGLLGYVTMQSWLFLSSYDKLRFKIANKVIYSLLKIGFNSFPELNSQVAHATAFIIGNICLSKYKGRYFDLNTNKTTDDKDIVYRNKIISGDYYTVPSSVFLKFPNYNFAFWLSTQEINILINSRSLGNILDIRQGLATGDNERFLREWYEVQYGKIGFGLNSAEEFSDSQKKYAPYNKSGDYRKWYGNCCTVVMWENDGAEIKNFIDGKGKLRSRPQNISYYFRRGITWSLISTNTFAARLSSGGFIFDVGGSSGFANETMILYCLGLLCSKVTYNYLKAFNPTINFQIGDVKNVPFVYDATFSSDVERLVKECVGLAKNEWDSYEVSWDFKINPIVKISKAYHLINIGEASELLQNLTRNSFTLLKDKEETLNSIYLKIYGLSEEYNPYIENKTVSIRLENIDQLVRNLISYAVGCMFGRYSLDKEGLAYAGGSWDDSKYTSYQPSKHAIIPICDDEYFEDDIVIRFEEFLEVVFGHDTLEENLLFIADALGGKGQPREVIRNYFINDFYNDHCKTYQKRPIYWLFDSGKKNGFKCLIYMHRYETDTIARIRTDYVHEQQSRYRTAIADLERQIDNASTAEKVKLNKKLKTLQDQSDEIHTYEEKIHHLADQMISIDLDDGVKHNYAIFQDVLAKIK
jgi:hypothetical protein